MVKRVLLVLPGAFSGVGGIEMYNRQVIRAFSELGRDGGIEVRAFILNDSQVDVDGRYVPRGAAEPRCFSRKRAGFGSTILMEAVAFRPELVVFGHVHFTILAPVLRRILPRALFWVLVYGIEVWRPLSKRVRGGLSRADKVFSISEFSRVEVIRNGGVPEERTGLLPCALDPVWEDQYGPRPDDSNAETGLPQSVLTVARLHSSERYKGIDSLIRAFPAVLERVPGALLDIVGEGDDRPRLESLARDEGVGSSVRFHGRLWPGELATAYRDCTLFAMPSSKEGFGIVFLEAALFGKTSLAGRHGGTPEVVVDGVTGILVDREDVAAIASALQTLLLDPAETARLGENAWHRLQERYTYGRFRERLASALEGSDGREAESNE